jgi:hypothetical protein
MQKSGREILKVFFHFLSLAIFASVSSNGSGKVVFRQFCFTEGNGLQGY